MGNRNGFRSMPSLPRPNTGRPAGVQEIPADVATAQALGLAMSRDNVFAWDDPRLEGVETFGSGHAHFLIQCFLSADVKDGSLNDVITVDVEASNYLAAFARAREWFPGRQMRLHSIRETCTLDKALAGEP